MIILEAFLEQYWPILMTVGLTAALILILLHHDHHDGSST